MIVDPWSISTGRYIQRHWNIKIVLKIILKPIATCIDSMDSQALSTPCTSSTLTSDKYHDHRSRSRNDGMYMACTANSSVICMKHTSYTLQVEAIPSYVNSWLLSPSWYAWRLSKKYTWKLTSMAIVFVWDLLDPSKKGWIFLNNWKLGTSFLTYIYIYI